MDSAGALVSKLSSFFGGIVRGGLYSQGIVKCVSSICYVRRWQKLCESELLLGTIRVMNEVPSDVC